MKKYVNKQVDGDEQITKHYEAKKSTDAFSSSMLFLLIIGFFILKMNFNFDNLIDKYIANM